MGSNRRGVCYKILSTFLAFSKFLKVTNVKCLKETKSTMTLIPESKGLICEKDNTEDKQEKYRRGVLWVSSRKPLWVVAPLSEFCWSPDTGLALSTRPGRPHSARAIGLDPMPAKVELGTEWLGVCK